MKVAFPWRRWLQTYNKQKIDRVAKAIRDGGFKLVNWNQKYSSRQTLFIAVKLLSYAPQYEINSRIEISSLDLLRNNCHNMGVLTRNEKLSFSGNRSHPLSRLIFKKRKLFIWACLSAKFTFFEIREMKAFLFRIAMRV